MDPDELAEIQEDLKAQGLADTVTPDAVASTFRLFETDAGYDPGWVYNPEGEPGKASGEGAEGI